MNSLLLRIFCAILMLTGAPAQDWQQAPRGHEWKFPTDHGSHPAQRIEWWYFTGNVATTEGHAFGYQLTFFRIGTEFAPVNPSVWAVRDLHMAHFAISDLTAGHYHAAQRLGRAGPGLAGADEAHLKVWNTTWRAEMQEGNRILLTADQPQGAEELQLKLQLSATGPLVRHGEEGYSRKGQQEGNASLYYSFTRMPTQGSLSVGGKTYPVTGQSWMDHEFGTSFLELGQVGWDWFSLQLDDGSDLMLFQIRNALPGVPATFSGTLIRPDGTIVRLTPQDVTLVGTQLWKSPQTQGQYPLHWEIKLPTHQGSLTVTTKLSEQEMHGAPTGPSYWEGAVEAVGTCFGHPVTGKGYLEMTGYAGGMGTYFAVGK